MAVSILSFIQDVPGAQKSTKLWKCHLGNKKAPAATSQPKK